MLTHWAFKLVARDTTEQMLIYNITLLLKMQAFYLNSLQSLSRSAILAILFHSKSISINLMIVSKSNDGFRFFSPPASKRILRIIISSLIEILYLSIKGLIFVSLRTFLLPCLPFFNAVISSPESKSEIFPSASSLSAN